MKGTSLLRPKIFLTYTCVLPRIELEWLNYGTWYSLHMHYTQWMLRCSRSVMKGTFLQRPKQFFVHISSRIAVWWLKYATCHRPPPPANALRVLQIRLKWVSNEGHFTLDLETIFRPYLPCRCSGLTETCHMVLPAHAREAVQVSFKSVCYAGHFTLDLETIFRPYLPCRCSGLTEICHMVLPAHAREAVQVSFKSVCNEGHFTRDAEITFRPCLPSHCCGVTVIFNIALPAHSLQAVQVMLES
jgi:hypothetical protein